MDEKKTVFITGANRGIGFEFARQFSANSYHVFGGCRKPEKAKKLKNLLQPEHILTLDVQDEDSIAKGFDQLKKLILSLDILINNAGIIGNKSGLKNFTTDDLIAVFQTNTLGPLLVVKKFLPLLIRGSKVFNISSKMGSIGDNHRGGYYSYRLSKAALNMATKTLHQDLIKKQVAVTSLHPGWVRTRMGTPIAPVSPKKSVSGLLKIITSPGEEISGKFFSYTGEEMHW